MSIILGRIFIVIAIIGLLVIALIAFPAFRKAISNFLKAIGTWCRKHLLACISIVVIILAIAMNNITARCLMLFAYLAIGILAIRIMMLAFSKKPSAKKACWRTGIIAALLILVAVFLEKLPW